MKAALVVDETQMQAARGASVSSDLSLRGPGHREVSFHEGDRCTGRCISRCVRVLEQRRSSFLGGFALIKLDLPIDENVHLNVNTHISRPPVKYGGFGGII